jgi:hypothetical protein
MKKLVHPASVCVFALSILIGMSPAALAVVLVNTGNVDGRMATASRPGVGIKTEIEAADDFILNTQSLVNSATFIGLLTGASPTIGKVDVEIYRVFPLDSTNPPDGSVPTRTNSPSDNAFHTRDTLVGNMTFSLTTLAASFTASNSVLNGINPIPNQTTGGEGSVTGTEVQFNANFTIPFNLPPDHYFFVPQVQVTGGEFYWLSSVRPIVSPGIPFLPDLQAWVRNASLDPNWLRVGTDIVGGTAAPPPTFNNAFILNGIPIPEPCNWLFGAGMAASIAIRFFAKRGAGVLG